MFHGIILKSFALENIDSQETIYSLNRKKLSAAIIISILTIPPSRIKINLGDFILNI